MKSGAMRLNILMNLLKQESRALFTDTHGGVPFQLKAHA
jgi:hypothetical protein